uniref:Uncharacterized protein n=1 Tax=Leersia perrieri TaxID=77586 RepID=A0A0D9V217_9ORYZ
MLRAPSLQTPEPPNRIGAGRMTTTATRRWWKRRGGDGMEGDDDDLVPMDIQEQEEMVQSLEQKQAQQSRRWRRYHAYFMEDLPSPMVIAADWIAALACLFSVKGLIHSSKKWMWYSFYVSILIALFWTYYLLRLPRIRWDVAWLPFGPLIASALSLYVDHSMLESMKDINTLRSYMYNYKAL